MKVRADPNFLFPGTWHDRGGETRELIGLEVSVRYRRGGTGREFTVPLSEWLQRGPLYGEQAGVSTDAASTAECALTKVFERLS